MFNRIIVPVDGSDAAWAATAVGDRLAAACDAELEILHVAAIEDPANDWLRARVDRTQWAAGTPHLAVIGGHPGVADAIAGYASRAASGVLVMATSGRGRSEAVLGSVASEVLALTGGPLIAVGPQVDAERAFAGDELLVTVDGSDLSESALGVAGAWAAALQLRPWVASVIEPQPAVTDAVESGYVSRAAHHLAAETGGEVEFEVLHHDRPARAISEFADNLGARFIVMATHGRGGLARLTLGSVAAGVVRHARCPVVLLRPAGATLPAGDRESRPATV